MQGKTLVFPLLQKLPNTFFAVPGMEDNMPLVLWLISSQVTQHQVWGSFGLLFNLV